MNFTISYAGPKAAIVHVMDAPSPPAEQGKVSDRLVLLPYTPLSNQAYLASKVLMNSWNNKHFFSEGQEVLPKVSRCFFSVVQFFIHDQRTVGAFTGALLSKRSELRQKEFDFSSCKSLRNRITQQRTWIAAGECSLCFATFAKIIVKGEPILITLLQGKEADGSQFLLSTSTKISHIQRFRWTSKAASDADFLPLIFKTTPDAAIRFHSWPVKKERIMRTLNKLPTTSLRKVKTISRLPPWTAGVWVEVDLHFLRPERPLPLARAPYQKPALIRRIDYLMKNSFVEILPYGLQLQTIHQTHLPLQAILDVTSSPNSIVTHCKLNALGLAARICGPKTAYECSERAMITKFSVFEEELKAFGKWILNAREKERAALVLFYLKAAHLKGGAGETSFYGSHLFLMMMTNATKKDGDEAVAYNVYGSYLGNYRIKELKKPMAIGEYSLNTYEFERYVLTPLKHILHAKKWCLEHDDSYHKLFAVRKPAMLGHQFEFDGETNVPIDSMPFKATFIPFRAKGRAYIRREEMEWAHLNPWLSVYFYSTEAYDRVFPNRTMPHHVRLKSV